MTQIITNPTSYSEQRPEDGVKDNWAAEYAKREVDKHREAEVLDHPDGSVTENKLSPDVRETIADAKGKSETAKETADNAKVMAQSAKDIADTASKESENAYEKSLDAYEKSQVAENIATVAKNKAESAEQRSVSAEAKADAATVSAGVAIEKADAAMKEAGDALAYGVNFLDARINEVEIRADEAHEVATNAINEAISAGRTASDVYSDVQTIKPELAITSAGTQSAYQLANDAYRGLDDKADKPSVFTYSYPSHEYEFNYMHNCDIRNGELTTLSFTFGNGEYQPDYTSGLSFDSGETPTAIDYTDSGILNWVGTDCVTSDGLSIFQPSANTHYDIVFYFNGKQFIGLVNGFVPATGNEAV